VVSAHLYNVKSGRINQVIPAAPLVEIGSQQ
jgi:hypothetical protein